MKNTIELTICTARDEGTGGFWSEKDTLMIEEGKQYLCAYMDDEVFMIYHGGMIYEANSIDFDF